MIQIDTRQVQLLAADLARAGANIQQTMSPELRGAAERVAGRARGNVHKLTGRTAQSITYSVGNRGLTYEVGPTWFVGRFLEYGTVNMPAYPFMRPAIAAEQDLPDRVADRVAEATLTGARSMPQSLV
jgi:HK97 gp10 family phage protein